LLISWIINRSAHKANGCRFDAGRFHKLIFRSPQATGGKIGFAYVFVVIHLSYLHNLSVNNIPLVWSYSC
jgi:hypothetical protein